MDCGVIEGGVAEYTKKACRLLESFGVKPFDLAHCLSVFKGALHVALSNNLRFARAAPMPET